jgi:transglutaminase-like putative cysteine protease
LYKKLYLLNLSGLLAYVALGGSVAAIAREAPFPALIIFILALIIGFAQDRKSFQNPVSKPLFLIPIVIAGIVISLNGINDQNFFSRILGIFLLVISAKLIAPKKPRDMLQIYLLNLLLVAAAAVTMWGLEFGLLALLESFISVTGLLFIYGSYEQQKISISEVFNLVRWSGFITLCLIPTTIIFFLILPRPSGIFFAWGRAATGKSGFSDMVTPGDVEQIKVDHSPAFRVKWLSGQHPRKLLWRGIVYDTYHRGAWEKRAKKRVDLPKITAKTVRYEVLLEPTDSKYLPVLALPGTISVKSQKPIIVSGYNIKIPKGVDHRILYHMESNPVTDLPADIPPRHYLDIPAELKQRLLPLAKGLVKAKDLGTALNVESFLKRKFAYSLLPGKAHGDPVIHFLFFSKKGHCEYFASAMVMMLRSLGIPARIVGGHLGGDWNELGHYYLIHKSDAHTWVEVWVKDRGWVTFDPTPQVIVKEMPFVTGKITRFIDFLRLKWYYWVLDYDLGHQLDLARKTASLFQSLGSGESKIGLNLMAPDFETIIPFLIVAAFILFLKIGWPYFHSRPKTLGERFVHALQNQGYKKDPGETLREYAHRIDKHDSRLGQKASVFVNGYYLLEYGQKGERETLYKILKEMRYDLKQR